MTKTKSAKFTITAQAYNANMVMVDTAVLGHANTKAELKALYTSLRSDGVEAVGMRVWNNRTNRDAVHEAW